MSGALFVYGVDFCGRACNNKIREKSEYNGDDTGCFCLKSRSTSI